MNNSTALPLPAGAASPTKSAAASTIPFMPLRAISVRAVIWSFLLGVALVAPVMIIVGFIPVPATDADASRPLRFLNYMLHPGGTSCGNGSARWNRADAFARTADSFVDFRAPSASLAGMDCRASCGACCIAPSITSPIPGMPHGKPAGIACVQLLPDMRCALFGRPERPAFCASLRPSQEMCGASRADALAFLAVLEHATR